MKKRRRRTDWPFQDESSLIGFYGDVGKNQKILKLPYSMITSWPDQATGMPVRIKRISCHEKVHDSLQRIFQKALDHYGIEKIRELNLDIFGGCLNIRKISGGSEWSVHAWGAAIDLDPENNQLKWDKNRALLARPECEAFWQIVESEGWVSLGRKRDFDWMHFQAAKL